MFDCERPTVTDPFQDGRELKWSKSSDKNTFYFWAQPVPIDISFLPEHKPLVIDCESGNTLAVYQTPTKIDLLYRLHLAKTPRRFMCKPFDHALFWTYGKEGGPSKLVKPLFKDRNLAVNKWVDKESFLAVVRTNHFAHYEYAFWGR